MLSASGPDTSRPHDPQGLQGVARDLWTRATGRQG